MIFALLCLVVSSCVTVPEADEVSTPVALMNSIRASLQEPSDSVAAIAKILEIEKLGIVEDSFLDEAYSIALERGLRSFERHLEAGEYRRALVFHDSLSALDEAPSSCTRDDILRLEAEAFLEKGLETAAGAVLARISSDPPDSAEREHGDPASMVPATVTIWVNKGISLKQGIGTPDVVIGSGFFVERSGYILTNYHIIESQVDAAYRGYSKLSVKLSSQVKEKIPAKVVGWDPLLDLALLKAEIDAPVICEMDRKEGPVTGERVFAIGSPIGLENTVSSGIVSAVGRRYLQIGDAMQIDAPVNPGNSGGPLLDEDGRLVGIVFAGVQQFQGINFAIPVTWIEAVLPRLFEGGKTVHSWLGVSLVETSRGLEVVYPVPGSPAYDLGLEYGDLIRSIGGRNVATISEAHAVLLEYAPGTMIRVGWESGSLEAEGLAILESRPDSPVLEARDTPENLVLPTFGMKLAFPKPSLFETTYLVQDVVPGSIAEEIGISPVDSVSVRNFVIDGKNKTASIDMVIRTKKRGFWETPIQVTVYVELDSFI